MKTHNAQNERIKRAYFAYLTEAKGVSEATLDGVAKALNRFETYTKFRDFKAFHIEQARPARCARVGAHRVDARRARTVVHRADLHRHIAPHTGAVIMEAVAAVVIPILLVGLVIAEVWGGARELPK